MELTSKMTYGPVRTAVHKCGDDPAFLAWDCAVCGKRGLTQYATWEAAQSATWTVHTDCFDNTKG